MYWAAFIVDDGREREREGDGLGGGRERSENEVQRARKRGVLVRPSCSEPELGPRRLPIESRASSQDEKASERREDNGRRAVLSLVGAYLGGYEISSGDTRQVGVDL